MSVVESSPNLSKGERSERSEVGSLLKEVGFEGATFCQALRDVGYDWNPMSPEEIERFAEHFERESIQIENSLCRDGRAADPVDFKDAQFPSRK